MTKETKSDAQLSGETAIFLSNLLGHIAALVEASHTHYLVNGSMDERISVLLIDSIARLQREFGHRATAGEDEETPF